MLSTSIKSKLYTIYDLIKYIIKMLSTTIILAIILCHFELFESISKDRIFDWISSVYESLLIAFSVILPLLYGFITNTKTPPIKKLAYLNFRFCLITFLFFMFAYFYVSYLSYSNKDFITENFSQSYAFIKNFYNEIQFIFNNQSFTDYTTIQEISFIISIVLIQIYYISSSVWIFIKNEEYISITESIRKENLELENEIAELSKKKEKIIKDYSIPTESKKTIINSLEKRKLLCHKRIQTNYSIYDDFYNKPKQ